MKRMPDGQQSPKSVAVGDEVYFHHSSGPGTGRVVSHGKHGCTVDAGGVTHRIKWDRLLGHKKRAAQRFNVVDEGEDGMIVEDASGKRRYLHIPPDSREDKMVMKSDGGNRIALFMKAGEIANRPGLHLEKKTDKTGRQAGHWVRNDKGQPAEKKPSKADAEAGSDAGFGTHNLQAGDKVSFRAGSFEGSGEIVGKPGKDGAHVKDESGRVHQVHWAEITGHDNGDSSTKPKVQASVIGEQKPIHADKFSAADYAKSHDKADVTPEEILSHFPPDTFDKIKDVQERLKNIEETVGKFKDANGDYSPERQQLHQKIYDVILSDERIQAATPKDGEKPKFIILGGRGGSGKSWFEGNVYDPDSAIVLDADHIKGMLPEYEGWNAAQIHEESGEVFDHLVQLARDAGVNVVLDKTMKTAKSAIADVNAFKDAGYQTEAHYMHLPRQEAAKRAVSRFLGKTKRYVPVEVVLSNTSNEHAFDQVKHLVDDWSFRDNNVAHGNDPILISKKGGSGEGEKLTKSDQSPTILLWRSKT